jgi:hypothetical protein
MNKYPNLEKVDGRFGLLKNKGWFLNLGSNWFLKLNEFMSSPFNSKFALKL